MSIWNGSRLSSFSMVTIYLMAIVAANVTVMLWGPEWSIVNAFLFIGLNLVSRDGLHDLWGENVRRNMLFLILAGAALSWLLGAGRIGIASAIAFAASEAADALVYHRNQGKEKRQQVNNSNIAGAMVDSIVFPILAFGFPPLIPIILGQFAAKVLGGLMWSIIIFRDKQTTLTPE